MRRSQTPSPCLEPGCPETVPYGYCEAHRRPSRSGRRMPAGWKATRARIVARDGGICHWCGRRNSTSCDHLVPPANGGTDDDANLVCCCWPCNQSKGDRPAPSAHGRAGDVAAAGRSAAIA